MRLYLAVDAIPVLPLKPRSLGREVRKYSFRLLNCSINLTNTLSKLIHLEVQCLFKC